MDLHLLREPATDGVVLGKLHIDGRFTWYTLERPEALVRPGRYPVVMSYSRSYDRRLPAVVTRGRPDHPIRFHPGAANVDLPGSIILGGGINKSTHLLSIVYTQQAVERFSADLDLALACGETVNLTIEDP